jgi:hypothetical protein
MNISKRNILLMYIDAIMQANRIAIIITGFLFVFIFYDFSLLFYWKL